jgi:hypothetical protein
MSNSKISALTSATTPLAGTEVLPIVQSGATVKVANNDLRPKQIQSNATSGVLQVAGPSAASTRVMTTPDANFTAARTDAAQSFTGDQTLSTGNLVIGTSGKGIDFSATPGTGTSELLADYEEGLITATVTPSTSGSVTLSGSNNTLQYTKVGRLVTVSGQLSVSSVSSPVGYAAINLPFAISDLTNTAGRSGASVMMDGTVSAVPNAFFAIGVEGASEFRIYVANSGTGVAATAANQMQTNTAIWINFSYVA